MDRFDAMQAFIRVVESGSFTKAAATLQMNKTTITQLIQQLETRLRVKLLNRTTRKVHVTADGAVYYEHAVRLLAAMDDAETSLSNAVTTPRGKLRIDVPSPLARLILVPALPEFYAQYPDIQIDLGASDRKVDMVRENIDCVIRGGSISERSLIARHVGDLTIGAYAAPNYLARAGTPIHPNQLEQSEHYLVGYLNSQTGKVAALEATRDGNTVRISGRYQLAVDDGNAYLAAGLAGLGIILLPTYMAKAHEPRGELHRLFEQWAFSPMPLYLAFPPNRYLSVKLRVFIDWVIELMAHHAPKSAQ
ncbi:MULTISPECIES: LysR family transcriptional regulator [Symbiopectobacterium]|uniref:LysR substrate-binding domain-containing protein n=1 Tax=Symbiopectobacterium TaxID=801 RepID=UPI001A30CDA0|nr:MULTISPECIES: LysR family transcriptional regulator [Symbiopectobacterium]MBG6248233.1 LysR family transcriptional regulator [Candidatus Symbiopectobacterium sp. PLON1]MBT9430875.1 LysR family transcriptional regulator [Candidatus Symbiopectobacterium endolongispinus]